MCLVSEKCVVGLIIWIPVSELTSLSSNGWLYNNSVRGDTMLNICNYLYLFAWFNSNIVVIYVSFYNELQRVRQFQHLLVCILSPHVHGYFFHFMESATLLHTLTVAEFLLRIDACQLLDYFLCYHFSFSVFPFEGFAKRLLFIIKYISLMGA